METPGFNIDRSLLFRLARPDLPRYSWKLYWGISFNDYFDFTDQKPAILYWRNVKCPQINLIYLEFSVFFFIKLT